MNKVEIIQEKLNEIDDIFIAGSFSEEKITEAEILLDSELPRSYKQFLTTFGNVSYGPYEIFGLTNSPNPEKAGIPNVVGYNLKKWNLEDFPRNLLIIQNNNNEQYICLKLDKKIDENECALIVWDNINKCEDTEINGNFINYLIDEIDEYIEEFI